ncbi:MAG: hypothetical protein AB7Q29_12440 [Vicinamibacterales bacterium]
MIRFILISLLLTFLLRAVVRIVSEALRAYRGVPSGGRRTPARGVQMARDPVCGTFVVPDRAAHVTVGGERLYFCSAACLDRYRAEQQARAASRGRTA